MPGKRRRRDEHEDQHDGCDDCDKEAGDPQPKPGRAAKCANDFLPPVESPIQGIVARSTGGGRRSGSGGSSSSRAATDMGIGTLTGFEAASHGPAPAFRVRHGPVRDPRRLDILLAGPRAVGAGSSRLHGDGRIRRKLFQGGKFQVRVCRRWRRRIGRVASSALLGSGRCRHDRRKPRWLARRPHCRAMPGGPRQRRRQSYSVAPAPWRSSFR